MSKHISRKERQTYFGIGPAKAHFNKGEKFSYYYTLMSDTDCSCGCGKLLKNCPAIKGKK